MIHRSLQLAKSLGMRAFFVPILILAGFQFVSGLSIASYTTDSDGVTFTCNTGKMKIKVCQADIVRVTYTPTSSFPVKTSLTVNKTFGTPAFTTSEAGDTITLLTNRIKAKVSRSTAAITYTDLSNNVVLSEYDKSMTAVTVEGISTYTCNTMYHSPTNEALYGLGQHMIDGGKGTTIVNYKGRNQTMDNKYSYINYFWTSIPLLVSTRGYGVFWDNYSRSWFYGGEGSNTRYRYTSECGDLIDYYFFYGPEHDQVISLFRTVTGRVPMLPKWLYGLIQSKDKYRNQNEYLSIKDGYRNGNIPVDCIVQDWGYWEPNPWGSHIMDPSRWPNPKSMVDQMHAANIKTMISIWPVFKSGSSNFTELLNAGALWTSAGTHRFLDPYHANGRSIYWRQMRDQLLLNHGWDSWWCDNTEPDPYPDQFDRHSMNTAMGKGCLYYNTYSLMVMLEGYTRWRADITGKRAALLTRTAFAGQQRTGAISWNNDISCNFGALANSIPAGLHFSLSGNPNWCTDIGGYWGHSLNWATAANRELFTRWFQYGAFCSIFRIHGGGSRELYSTNWDATTKANLLKIDQLRYRLMPYVYSLAWKVTNDDYTIQRHLVMDFRTDANVHNIGNQFMFGPALLVSPITTAGATSRSAYLPAGTWYDFWTGATVAGGTTITAGATLDKIPLHVRAGSIIPMGPIIQYATQRSDSIELRVYPGANGSFTMYEDEGDNYNYESGSYATIPITYNNTTGKVTIGTRSGSFSGMQTNKVFSIVFVTAGHGVDLGKTTSPDCIVNYSGVGVTACPVTGTCNHCSSRKAMNPGPVTMKTAQTKVVLSAEFSGKVKEIGLYDCSGRFLQKIVTRKQKFDIRKDFGLPAGVYILKVKALP
ncbi:MAG: glycoside hydrolase family 31 protein [Chitinispirillaceae bacterium]|nr:glycoside hydrolase family 31 protein [Chitinispirillaceae bacterium]